MNILTIKNMYVCVSESVATVSFLSTTVVAHSLGSSFSNLLPRFSPHRLKFFFTNEADALEVIFSISDPPMVGSGVIRRANSS